MNERPTPETDAIVRNAATADHPMTRLAATLTVKCEKLERERDEAREERDIAKLEVEEVSADYQQAVKEINKMREAIIATLEENRHLADGDDCTLAKLKSVVPDWK